MDAADGSTIDHDAGPTTEGDYPVGTTLVELPVADDRVLPLQLWYPAIEAARAEARAGHPTEELEPPGARRDELASLVAAAPPFCTNRTFHAAIEAEPSTRETSWPLIVFSHHFTGIRFSSFSLAEGLAAAGFVVAAPNHEGDTIYDRGDNAGNPLEVLSAEFLMVRVGDMKRVLDELLDADSQVVPVDLRGRIDATRVGAAGHSFGGLTTGMLAASEPRIHAAAYLAIPPSLELIGSPAPDRLAVPALYLAALEDGTVGGLDALTGGDIIREQFEAQRPQAWLVEVRDTAHWSFADDCALIPELADGCGMGTRPATGESYTNLDNAQAREIGNRYTIAFFVHQLQGGPADGLELTEPAALVTVDSHDERAP